MKKSLFSEIQPFRFLKEGIQKIRCEKIQKNSSEDIFFLYNFSPKVNVSKMFEKIGKWNGIGNRKLQRIDKDILDNFENSYFFVISIFSEFSPFFTMQILHHLFHITKYVQFINILSNCINLSRKTSKFSKSFLASNDFCRNIHCNI